jgi:hypothetical protein
MVTPIPFCYRSSAAQLLAINDRGVRHTGTRSVTVNFAYKEFMGIVANLKFECNMYNIKIKIKEI